MILFITILYIYSQYLKVWCPVHRREASLKGRPSQQREAITTVIIAVAKQTQSGRHAIALTRAADRRLDYSVLVVLCARMSRGRLDVDAYATSYLTQCEVQCPIPTNASNAYAHLKRNVAAGAS